VRRKGKTLGKDGIEGLSVIQTLKAIEGSLHCYLDARLERRRLPNKTPKSQASCRNAVGGLLIFAIRLTAIWKKGAAIPARAIPTPQKLTKGFGRRNLLAHAVSALCTYCCRFGFEGKFREERFFALLRQIEKARHLEIPTTELNRYIEGILNDQPLPIRKGKRLKLYYMTQALERNVLAPEK